MFGGGSGGRLAGVAPLTREQVNALHALAVAGDEELCELLSAATWTDREGVRHVRQESYSARRLATIAADLEAAS